MGLDQYLKSTKMTKAEIDEVRNFNRKLEERDSLGEKVNWDDYKYIQAETEMDWRKANHIHKWFVDNVQNGVDDCEPYYVSKEQLEALRDACEKVIYGSKLEAGMIQNGSEMKMDDKGNFVQSPIIQKGYFLSDTAVAEKYLPTQDGFFFGGTDYDQWYFEDTETTYEGLTDLLQKFNFDEKSLFYKSSW